MEIPDEIGGPGDIPAEAMLMQSLAVGLGAPPHEVPAIVLLPLGAVTAVVRDGRAVVADAHTMMLRHAGAQSVTMSPSGWPEFPAQVTPGWRGRLTEADLLITADGWHGPVYDGAFGADQDWLVDASEQQRTCGGVIVVYAPVFAVDLLPAAIADGRLLAVRVPFTSMA